MNKKIFRKVLSAAAGIALPDSCALCGTPLTYLNCPAPGTPLCLECTEKAISEIFENRYPDIRRCASCGYPITSESESCFRCRNASWNFISAESLYLYTGTGKTLVTEYKFENRRQLSVFFSKCFQKICSKRYQDFTLVPVPYRKSARRKRGWDQIEQITNILQKDYCFPCVKCLRRTDGPAQKTMDYARRLMNLENRIQVRPGAKIPHKVLLIDDVFTTGATLNTCAGVLKCAGAETVCCLTIAQDL